MNKKMWWTFAGVIVFLVLTFAALEAVGYGWTLKSGVFDSTNDLPAKIDSKDFWFAKGFHDLVSKTYSTSKTRLIFYFQLSGLIMIAIGLIIAFITVFTVKTDDSFTLKGIGIGLIVIEAIGVVLLFGGSGAYASFNVTELSRDFANNKEWDKYIKVSVSTVIWQFLLVGIGFIISVICTTIPCFKRMVD